MKVTYQREIDHCEPTKYALEATIADVLDAANSDNLAVLRFRELGWNAVVKKGLYAPGDKVFFIPVDSVLPVELSDMLGVTNYLSKGRVRPTTLRGNRSEGLVVDKDIVEPWLPHILKWEDLPDVRMSGEILSSREIPFDFEAFYRMPNLLNEPNTFSVGEYVAVSEKIHGTNFRFGRLPHPETGEPTFYVGSHNMVHKLSSDSIYVSSAKNLLADDIERLPLGKVFYGEIFGRKIQHLDYGRSVPEVRIFAVAERSRYLTPDETTRLCLDLALPAVSFHRTIFEGVDRMRELAEGRSEYTVKHHREGVVVRSTVEGGRMAKILGNTYLSGKKRTEKH